jgi:hypothetical protein
MFDEIESGDVVALLSKTGEGYVGVVSEIEGNEVYLQDPQVYQEVGDTFGPWYRASEGEELDSPVKLTKSGLEDTQLSREVQHVTQIDDWEIRKYLSPFEEYMGGPGRQGTFSDFSS